MCCGAIIHSTSEFDPGWVPTFQTCPNSQLRIANPAQPGHSLSTFRLYSFSRLTNNGVSINFETNNSDSFWRPSMPFLFILETRNVVLILEINNSALILEINNTVTIRWKFCNFGNHIWLHSINSAEYQMNIRWILLISMSTSKFLNFNYYISN